MFTSTHDLVLKTRIAKSSLFLLLILSTGFNVDCNNDSFVNVEDSDSGYNTIKTLQDSILSSANYSTNLRPVNDQTTPLIVAVTFSLVAVVAVDNVKQEVVTNGFLFLFWEDERIRWDPDKYGGFHRLSPTPKDIWRPRLLLINTVGERDPFEDDYSHTFFASDGMMGWVPGGIFHTYCALNMEKFPFDVQDCKIQFCPMSHTNTSIQFEAKGVNLAFYYANPGWELLNANMTTENISVVEGETFSCPTFSFQLKRRSSTVVLNVIIPVIMLSVLNNLVFLIPVDSGEKISYAITVLLSLAVFLSMVSTMTPQVSDVVPALTIYLFVLLLSSVLTVAAAILTVFLHHLDEKEETSIKNKFNFQTSVKKLITVKTAVAPLETIQKDPLCKNTKDDSAFVHDAPIAPGHNPYRTISKHVNKFFFVVMTGLSAIMTMWYFIFTSV